MATFIISMSGHIYTIDTPLKKSSPFVSLFEIKLEYQRIKFNRLP